MSDTESHVPKGIHGRGCLPFARASSQPLTVHGPEDAKLSSEDSTSSPCCRRGGA